jgi:hypothetical protein
MQIFEPNTPETQKAIEENPNEKESKKEKTKMIENDDFLRQNALETIFNEEKVKDILVSFLDLREIYLLSLEGSPGFKKRVLEVFCRKNFKEKSNDLVKEVWKYAINLPKVQKVFNDDFVRCSEQPTKCQRDIKVDLHRTFSNYPYFQESSKYHLTSFDFY